jgi:hypothetical protein
LPRISFAEFNRVNKVKMKRHFKKIIFCVIFFSGFLVCQNVQAADFYISQTAQGNGAGTSCANSHAIAGITWGASGSNVSDGDTLHLCNNGGAFTTALSISRGGIDNNHRTTILFEPGANFTKPAWASTGAINISDNLSYITIDGGATGTIGGYKGNASYVNGIIQNTANGTGLANQISSAGISATSVHYLTIKNLAIYNLYVRTSYTDESAGGTGISIGDWGNGVDHILITNCLMHDMATGAKTSFRIAGNTDVEISYNTVYNANWGGAIADTNTSSLSSMTNVLVHNNYFHDWANWDDCVYVGGPDSYHHNGFFIWGTQGSVTNPMYYNNVLGPGYSCNTSGLFLQSNVVGATVFNNLFIAGTAGPADGQLYIDQTSGVINVYNNTFISQSKGGSMNIDPEANSTLNIENNLSYTTNSTNAAFFADLYVRSGITWNVNNNSYYNYGSTPWAYNTTGSGNWYTTAQFQALIGSSNCTNDISINPNLNSDYTEKSNSPTVGAGVNLTSLGITALNNDMDDVARPSSGAWDIGAYEYVSGTTDTTPPSAPSGLSVQ